MSRLDPGDNYSPKLSDGISKSKVSSSAVLLRKELPVQNVAQLCARRTQFGTNFLQQESHNGPYRKSSFEKGQKILNLCINMN